MRAFLGIIFLVALGTIRASADRAPFHSEGSRPSHREKRQGQNLAFFEGDIALDSQDMHHIVQGGQLNSPRPWPGGVIPYEFAPHFTLEDELLIGRAMIDFETKTCIRFVRRRPEHGDYIYIMKDADKCYSYIGNVGGQQRLSLDDKCMYHGVILHELMHALGFYHEQQRHDRDDYVTVNWGNVKHTFQRNFLKDPKRHRGDGFLPYDYESITHYDSRFLASKLGEVNIGQRNRLSSLDVLSVKWFYNCPDESQPKGCDNVNPYFCPLLASNGYCDEKDMKNACRIACNTCGYRPDSCQDTGDNCYFFLQQRQCQERPHTAARLCARTCDLCGTK